MRRRSTAGRYPHSGSGRTGRVGQQGSLSLELGMVLPFVAIVAYAVLQLVGVGTDALLAHEAAAIGARVAVTNPSDDAVVHAVRDAVGPAREVVVEIRPRWRRSGDLVTVEVDITSAFGPFAPHVRARAVGRAEPALGSG